MTMRKKVNRFLLALVSLITLGMTACSQDEPMVEPMANQQEVAGEATTRADVENMRVNINVTNKTSTANPVKVSFIVPTGIGTIETSGGETYTATARPLFVTADNGTMLNFTLTHSFPNGKQKVKISNQRGFEYESEFGDTFTFNQIVPLTGTVSGIWIDVIPIR